MAANYQHIGGGENRLGRHYSRFSAFWPPAALADQSLALRKSQNAGSNRRSRAKLRVPRDSLQGIIEIIGNARLRDLSGAIIRSRLNPPQVWISRSARVDLPWPICAMGWNRGTEVFAQLFLQVMSFLKLLSHLDIARSLATRSRLCART